MNDIDLVFKLDTDSKYRSDHRFLWSIDGRKNWQSHPFYHESDFSTLIRQAIGRFTVDHIIKPELKPGEELCYPCRNKGKVGVMRYARTTHGTESQTQMLLDECGEPYYDDVSHYCSYRIEKCDRCGHEDSDYA